MNGCRSLGAADCQRAAAFAAEVIKDIILPGCSIPGMMTNPDAENRALRVVDVLV